jgi:multiple sugar transport system substrate-binding protein
MLDFMDMAKIIVDNGYDTNSDPWSGEWIAAVESDDTFCYVLPTWGYQFVVKPSADTTIGKWALAEGPVPYVKGGTWLGIYKDSPNKDMAWAFMEYVCCNSEAQQEYAAEYGEYISLKSADEALATGEGEEVLGGQNLFAFFNGQMSKIPSDHMTAYDGQINTAFLSATKAYANGTLSKEEAIQQFKEDVATAYPEITVN